MCPKGNLLKEVSSVDMTFSASHQSMIQLLLHLFNSIQMSHTTVTFQISDTAIKYQIQLQLISPSPLSQYLK